MATQGVVTVCSQGKVVMKVVAGCDGMQARKLANRLRRRWPVTREQAYEIAEESGFGCKDCLTVMDRTRTHYLYDYKPHRRYRRTFSRPRFNPRWRHGIAGHVVVINI